MDDFRLILLAIIVVTGTFAYLLNEQMKCEQSGGVYVDAPFGHQCVIGKE